MILILFYMGVVPVRLGFSAYADDNAFVQGREAWYWVDFVADSVFLLDIAMNFFVIIKHGNGDYIVNFVDIAIFQIHSKWFFMSIFWHPFRRATCPMMNIPRSMTSGRGSNRGQATSMLKQKGTRALAN